MKDRIVTFFLMKRFLPFISIFIALSTPFVTYSEETKKVYQVTGELVTMNKETNSIKVKKGDNEIVLTTIDKTIITIEHTMGEVVNVNEGTNSVTVNKNDKEIVFPTNDPTKSSMDEKIQFKKLRIDSNKETISIGPLIKFSDLIIGDFLIRSEEKTFSDLTIGDKVVVKYFKNEGNNIAKSISVTK